MAAQLQNSTLSHPPPPALGSGNDDSVKAASSIIGPSVALKFRTVAPSHFPGPFTSSGQRYTAQIEHTLERLINAEKDNTASCDPGSPGTRKEDTASTRKEMIVVHRWMKEVVRSIPELWNESEEIMLKHADDKGDQLFRGEDGGLKCVMDWDW